MVECASFLKEANVADAEGLHSTFFFWYICSRIFARSPYAELGDYNLLDGGVVLEKLV